MELKVPDLFVSSGAVGVNGFVMEVKVPDLFVSSGAVGVNGFVVVGPCEHLHCNIGVEEDWPRGSESWEKATADKSEECAVVEAAKAFCLRRLAFWASRLMHFISNFFKAVSSLDTRSSRSPALFLVRYGMVDNRVEMLFGEENALLLLMRNISSDLAAQEQY